MSNTFSGDGLRCVSGSVIVLGTKNTGAGSATWPSASDPRLSIAGGVPLAGARRFYQVLYSNPPAYCTPSTFNLSNGLDVAWVP